MVELTAKVHPGPLRHPRRSRCVRSEGGSWFYQGICEVTTDVDTPYGIQFYRLSRPCRVPLTGKAVPQEEPYWLSDLCLTVCTESWRRLFIQAGPKR